MKREIKFRIIYNDKIEGFERLLDGGWECMALAFNPDHGERWIKGVYNWYEGYKRNQFTGLKDKKGKEIYEGDLYKTNYYSGTPGKHNRIVGLIKFQSPRFCVEGIGKYQGLRVELHSLGEVLGNEHENPELIKV
jgi:hypothetical protein